MKKLTYSGVVFAIAVCCATSVVGETITIAATTNPPPVATTNPPPQYPLYAEADELYSNTNTYDLTKETYTFSTLWSTPAQADINFLPGSYHSPIVTRGDDTFVLYVDTDHRMKIAHLTNGVFTGETFIDNTLYQPSEFYAPPASADYHKVKFEDSHHSLSMGVDENGYLHVVGDMHNYPRYSGSMAHLPLRYYNKNIMYWRSDNPLDISSFSFKGDQTGQCPPGYGFTYQFFFNDMYGKLHMTSRAHQATDNAMRCATYSRYDADTGTWSAIGGPDPSDPGSSPRTFYDDGREYDASNTNNKYSKTHPHGVFDRNNNMHLVAPLLSNPTLNPWGMGSGQHFVDTIVYAQSTNGTDYAKADGSSIILPATIDLTTNQADIIYNAPTDRYLSMLGNIAVDYQNNPYTVVRQKSYDPNNNNADNQSIVIGWDGTTWTKYGEIVVATTDFRLVHDPAGVMSYIPDSIDKFYRFWHPSETPRTINLPASWPYIKTIDYEYLKKTGNILGLSKIGGELTVVKVEINNRPGMELLDPPVETPPNHAPVITAPATATGYDLSVAATDADDDPLTFTWEKSYGPGDASFTLNGSTASSNTTASFTESGTYELKVTVSDGIDQRVSTCFLLFAAPNQPPEITSPATANGPVLSVAATDPEGDPLTFTWSTTSGPGDVYFTVNGTAASSNTTAVCSETGTYEMKVTVSDGVEESVSTCQLVATTIIGNLTTFQIGGGVEEERDARWDDLSTNGSTGTYSFADSEDPNLVFTITAIAHNGDTLDLNGTHLGVDSSARQSDPKTGRINDDEAIMLTVSYVDPGNSLAALEMEGFGTVWGNGISETTVFTDASANSTNIVAFNHTLPSNLVDYAATGLDPLTKYNTESWSMTVTVDDSLGITQSGMGGFKLAYLVNVGGSYNLPYTTWFGIAGLTEGVNDGYGDDAENGGIGDGLNNLLEYALGGDPLVDDAAAILPQGLLEPGFLNYTYQRRLDAAARGLSYDVLVTTNLVDGIWTNTTEEAGSAVLDVEFESVTNRVSIDAATQQFLKLEVGINE